MKNETIKFKDFLSDAADALGLDKNDLKPDTGVYYKCPKCKDYYSEKEKFCSNDGEAIVEEPYEYLSKDTKRFIMDILYDLTTAELPDSFPYEYVDSIEKRGDEYLEFKNKKAEQLLDLIEKKIPDIRSHVKTYYTSTPLTYRDYTGTVNGSIYGVIKDSNSPLKSFIQPRTKISKFLANFMIFRQTQTHIYY